MDAPSSYQDQFPQPVLPSGPKHFGLKTMFLIGGIILLAGIASGGVYVWERQQEQALCLEAGTSSDCNDAQNYANFVEMTVSPQPSDPIASWAIYSNKKYGYSMRYPSEWTLELYQANDPIVPQEHPGYQASGGPVRILSGAYASGGHLLISPPENRYTDKETWHFINLQVARPDPVVTVDQFVEEFPQSNVGGAYSRSELVIHGKNAVRFTSGRYENVLIKDPDHNLVYIFTYFRQNDDMHQKIIETFSTSISASPSPTITP